MCPIFLSALVLIKWTPVWAPVVASNMFVALSVYDLAETRLQQYVFARAQQEPRQSATDMAQRAFATLSEIFVDDAHQARITDLAQTALSTARALFYGEVPQERTLVDVFHSAIQWPTQAQFEGDYHTPAEAKGDVAFACYCITQLLCTVVLMRCVYLLCVYGISISRHAYSLSQRTLQFMTN